MLTRLHAREVLDSRGNPTVEVEAFSEHFSARFMVPSGASTGIHEALELRDNDPKRYHGKGVLRAVSNVNQILKQKLTGKDIFDQKDIDQTMIELDGTPNKQTLGANAILGVSLAVAELAAKERNQPLFQYLNPDSYLLPVPMMNVLNGGVHADNGIDFQEFMIMPIGAPTFREALRMGSEIFHTLKKVLHKDGFGTGVGDEGGFAPRLPDNHSALKYLKKAVDESGYKLGLDVAFALDPAASEFFEQGKGYNIMHKGQRMFHTSSQMVELWQELIEEFPIISIEDGLSQDDWEGWILLTEKLGNKIQLVGDDFLVTNPIRVKEAVERKAANSVLIKINQIGTLTETLETVRIAHDAGWRTVISHRSGETEDTTIADLSVATGSGQIKTGSLSRSERLCKYNQLLRIEEMLGEKAQYAGKVAIKGI